MTRRPGRSLLRSIGPTNFFAERQVRERGLPPIPLYDRLPRPIPEPVGPADFRNDRTDHPVSPEIPGEAHVETLEKMRSPRPILKLIGPIYFFAERHVGGEGRPVFLVAGAIMLRTLRPASGTFWNHMPRAPVPDHSLTGSAGPFFSDCLFAQISR